MLCCYLSFHQRTVGKPNPKDRPAYSVSGVGSLRDPYDQDSAQWDYVVMSSISLSPVVINVLSSLPIGPSGRAYLLDSNLNILGFSQPIANFSFGIELPLFLLRWLKLARALLPQY